MNQAQEQARVTAAREAIARLSKPLNKLFQMRTGLRLETQDGGFVLPVRAAVLQAVYTVGRSTQDRQLAIGLLRGCLSILTVYMPGTRLTEALELTCGKVADIMITDSAVWIEAQAEEIGEIVDMFEQVIAGSNPQAQAA